MQEGERVQFERTIQQLQAEISHLTYLNDEWEGSAEGAWKDVARKYENIVQLARQYTHVREEYDAHPWMVDAVSVMNTFQKLSDAMWELDRKDQDV